MVLTVVNSELLALLVCPKTKESLIMADEETVKSLNKKIQKGGVVNLGGEKVTEKIEAALLAKESKIVYTIKNQIPVLIYEKGIATN